MPIIHIQQLIGLALGISHDELKMNTHIIRPTGAIAAL
jgi:heterodisulfide reductase subunit B